MFRICILLFFLVSQLQAQTTMIIPPNLQKGDTIAIVATARKNIVDNLKPALDLAKSWGLNVVIGKTIGLDNHQLAGTDEERAADFQDMMDKAGIYLLDVFGDYKLKKFHKTESERLIMIFK